VATTSTRLTSIISARSFLDMIVILLIVDLFFAWLTVRKSVYVGVVTPSEYLHLLSGLLCSAT